MEDARVSFCCYYPHFSERKSNPRKLSHLSKSIIGHPLSADGWAPNNKTSSLTTKYTVYWRETDNYNSVLWWASEEHWIWSQNAWIGTTVPPFPCELDQGDNNGTYFYCYKGLSELFYTKNLEHCLVSKHSLLKETRLCHPQNMALWYKNYCELKAVNMQLSLSSPFLPKGRI